MCDDGLDAGFFLRMAIALYFIIFKRREAPVQIGVQKNLEGVAADVLCAVEGFGNTSNDGHVRSESHYWFSLTPTLGHIRLSGHLLQNGFRGRQTVLPCCMRFM